MTNQSAQRKFKWIILTFIAGVAGILLFNFILDPYDLYNRTPHMRPSYLVNMNYFTKSVKIIQQKPDILILGSSTVEAGFALPGWMNSYTDNEYGYKMRHTQLAIAPYHSIFNAGINGGTLYEDYQLLKHAHANNPRLKHVMLGLEWHQFTNERPPSKHWPDLSFTGHSSLPLLFYIKNNLSIKTTKSSLDTLLNYRNLLTGVNTIEGSLTNIQQTLSNIFKDHSKPTADNLPDYYNTNSAIDYSALPESKILMTSVYLTTELYNDFKTHGEEAVLNPEAFTYLKRIIEYAKTNHIKLDVYISPQHGTHWLTAEKFGLGEYVTRWLSQIAEITPYWDFSGNIDFGDQVNDYFGGDDRHFSFYAGEIVLSSIIKNKPDAKHGIVYVTSNNFSQFIKYRAEREKQWLKKRKSLALITASPNFAKLKNASMINPSRLLMHYTPAYHTYEIFEVMGTFIAIPTKYAPFHFSQVIRKSYPDMLEGSSLDDVLSKIDGVLQLKA